MWNISKFQLLTFGTFLCFAILINSLWYFNKWDATLFGVSVFWYLIIGIPLSIYCIRALMLELALKIATNRVIVIVMTGFFLNLLFGIGF